MSISFRAIQHTQIDRPMDGRTDGRAESETNHDNNMTKTNYI